MWFKHSFHWRTLCMPVRKDGKVQSNRHLRGQCCLAVSASSSLLLLTLWSGRLRLAMTCLSGLQRKCSQLSFVTACTEPDALGPCRGTCMLSHQSYLTLCSHMDCSPPGSSVHGVFQARILGWVAISFLLQGIVPTPRWNPNFWHFLSWQVDSFPLSHPGRTKF